MRLVAAILAASLAIAHGVMPVAAQTIRVGSKTTAEQMILGEIYAATLEANGFKVERRIGLGGTLIAHNALAGGEIDLYPEYTGTALKSVLKEPVMTDAAAVYARVKAFYESEFEITWLKPTRINNGSALVMRADTATRLGVRTLSDLGRVAAQLGIAAAPEFADRRDGLPGLKEKYGIEFARLDEIGALALRYEALGEGRVDVVKGFATDWQIVAGNFVVLEDDRHLFAPYFVAPVIRMETVEANPRVSEALNRASALLDDAAMRALNRQVEAQKEKPREVARAFLKARGAVP